jgi:hypothetical protein
MGVKRALQGRMAAEAENKGVNRIVIGGRKIFSDLDTISRNFGSMSVRGNANRCDRFLTPAGKLLACLATIPRNLGSMRVEGKL